MRYYPVYLDLAGQPAVVLGGGRLAAEKVDGLHEAGARVTVISAMFCAAIESRVAAGEVCAIRRDYVTGDLSGSRMVIDASDDAEINRKSWDEAEAAGILINVVDRPGQCRFIAPAVVRRDPLMIAISTSAESPFLASALRARLERWIGREWGPFTALVGRVRRELRGRGVPLQAQTQIYRELTRSGVRDLLRQGRAGEAQAMAAAIASAPGRPGRVAVVGAGPGDPELLTVRARELLADADFVLHDALVAPATLELCGPDARLEAVGKRGGLASARQEDITARLIELARAGRFVVRLKAGDPFVLGRGGEELGELAAAGVDVLVVPGISAALAAPAAVGVSVTMRGVASSVAITTGQGDTSLDRLKSLARAADTLVVLMARANLGEVSAALAQVVGATRPAALVSSATLPEQRSVSGHLSEIARLADRERIEAPATLIVGDVVAASPFLGAAVPSSSLYANALNCRS
jgi:uroporphyrin-III C-methyltransferase/precorrin-2 dehydrogenase/sirohydrochlorin ferrochelatase